MSVLQAMEDKTIGVCPEKRSPLESLSDVGT